MEEILEYLKKCSTYYLATIEGDEPRVRPFGTIEVFEGKLYIQTGKPVHHLFILGFYFGIVQRTVALYRRIHRRDHQLQAPHGPASRQP